MSKLFIGSIDLTKIKNELIVKTDKDGNPFKNGGQFINVSIWLNDEADKFGNTMSIQMGTKDEKIYLGNCKEYQKDAQTNQQPLGETDKMPWD